MSKRQVVLELHKPARKIFKRRRVIIKGLDDLWQADLVEMIGYSKVNKGYKYLETIIDTFSKFAWAIPIRQKTAAEVANSLKYVFNQGRIPKNLQTDDGKEFFNSTFKKLMLQHNINHYSTYSSLKASIVERFNRTLKNKMWVEFSFRGSYRWTDILSNLLDTYNKTTHRTIKMRPCDINRSNEKFLLSTVYNHIKIAHKPKYKIGDSVRINKYKHVFSKGYTPNWTTEIFTVKQIKYTNPTTYLLADYQGNPIKDGFYELELLKTAYPNVYLVEKILRKSGTKVFVKWLGFSNDHNTWINKNDVL